MSKTEVMEIQPGVSYLDPVSKTVQSEKANCDINKIMDRVQRTGTLPVTTKQPIYGDFSQVGDYHTALNTIRVAVDSFNALPSKVRRRFNDDPAHLLAFVSDPKNKDEAIELGLVSAPVIDKQAGSGNAPEPAAVPST